MHPKEAGPATRLWLAPHGPWAHTCAGSPPASPLWPPSVLACSKELPSSLPLQRLGARLFLLFLPSPKNACRQALVWAV